MACCIYRQNSQRFRESSNRPRLGKKTGGEPNEREKWNVTSKPCELNSFHSDTKRKEERKKQEVTSEMACFKVQKEHECVFRVEYRKYEKTEAWTFLGVQFVGHAFRLWWDGFWDICKFRPTGTDIKGVISALLHIVASQ